MKLVADEGVLAGARSCVTILPGEVEVIVSDRLASALGITILVDLPFQAAPCVMAENWRELPAIASLVRRLAPTP